MPNDIRAKLIHALTDYDRKQSTRRGYNPHALGIYFARVDEVVADIEAGATPRAAVAAGFTGRLADVCLKAIGEAKAQPGEEPAGWSYQPAALALKNS